MTRYDYSLFKRTARNPAEASDLQCDILISAHNDSERVLFVWDAVDASQRIWINHAEYGLASQDLPPSDFVHDGELGEGEIEFWSRLFESEILSKAPRDARLMFDITGLMRPHVIALPLALALHKFAKATAIYTDPSNYSSGTGTKFTLGPIKGVSPVNGFEGAHNTSVGQEDLLVIGAGYDDKLIRSVAESKKSAEQVVLVGLPSLQPHMYQESLLRLHRVSEFINNYSRHAHLFSPASDPFMTAQVVSDYLHKKPNRDSVNVYLCPTGPKTQALGFAWYFLCEAIGEATSIIFPYSNLYSRETSTGVGRVRTFELELECVELSKYAP